jgi:hypothetical protein
MTNLDKKYLYEPIHGPQVKEWWVQNDRIPEDALQWIDRELLSPTIKCMQFSRRKWVTKHVLANCRMGETLVKWAIQIDLDYQQCHFHNFHRQCHNQAPDHNSIPQQEPIGNKKVGTASF